MSFLTQSLNKLLNQKRAAWAYLETKPVTFSKGFAPWPYKGPSQRLLGPPVENLECKKGGQVKCLGKPLQGKKSKPN